MNNAAQAVAGRLGIPFIYAKKKRPLTMGEYYAAAGYSFTKQESTTLYVAKEVLRPGEPGCERSRFIRPDRRDGRLLSLSVIIQR